jgi:hypothetical protein
LVDVVFLRFAKSLANWIAKHWIFETLRGWILSLSPYTTLGSFALPVVILEPVKPMAAYLVGTGRAATGLILLAVGEILKLALVERLFSVSGDVEGVRCNEGSELPCRYRRKGPCTPDGRGNAQKLVQRT